MMFRLFTFFYFFISFISFFLFFIFFIFFKIFHEHADNHKLYKIVDVQLFVSVLEKRIEIKMEMEI